MDYLILEKWPDAITHGADGQRLFNEKMNDQMVGPYKWQQNWYETVEDNFLLDEIKCLFILTRLCIIRHFQAINSRAHAFSESS